MNRVFVTGDTHGGAIGDLNKLTSTAFPEGKELTKEDYVIVLGDFGFLWNDVVSATEQNRYDWFEEKPWTTLFLCGNHENFNRLDNLPAMEKFGNPVGRINDSLYHLKRGYVYKIAGKSFFVFGGGYSIDKASRKENVSWWAREMPSIKEYGNGLSQLAAVGKSVDYILTHSCSNRMFEELALHVNMDHKIDGEDDLRNYFDTIDETVTRKMWYYGHFHYDCLFDNHQVMYNLVKEIT